MKPIRVVLADDHDMVRACIRSMLEQATGIQVVGEARNGREAVEMVKLFAPDLLLLDMEMPVLSGVEVVKELRAAKSKVKIMAISAYDDEQFILGVLSSGVGGYLSKDEALMHTDTFAEGLRKVAHGARNWTMQRADVHLTI